jgi:hypothetical protein
MVDHDRGGQAAEEVPQFGKIGCFEVDYDMPAQLGDASRYLGQLLPGGEVHETL